MIHEHITYGYDYDTEKNILYGRKEISDYGFFSTFTLLITALMGTYNKYKKLPVDIDGTKLLRHLCKEDGYDMYKHFFHINSDVNIDFDTPMPVPYTNDDQHTVYRNEDVVYYSSFYKKYFNINKNISDKIDFILDKYKIDSENTISIVYRGTDKWTDFGGFNHISPGLYFRIAKELREKNPNMKILIQSESESVNRIFHQGLGSIQIEETLTSKIDGIPIFLYLENEKLNWAEYYVAALMIHSKSKILITYTGNSSFFLFLNRGTTENMYQEITFTKNNFEDFFVLNN